MQFVFGRAVKRIIIALILIALLTFALEAILPTLINDTAINQFENDNIVFLEKELVFKLQNLFGGIQGVIIVWVIIATAIDIFKYFKTEYKKEFKKDEDF